MNKFLKDMEETKKLIADAKSKIKDLDMILNGTCCEGCGVFINKNPPGYPSSCSIECAESRGAN